MRLRTRPTEVAEVAPLHCMCASLRRAARAVTQVYQAEVGVAGIQGTQFTILQVLNSREGITQGRLGEALDLDSTTLSRTLRLLEQRGWIRSLPGEDRRERRLALTPAGRRQLERVRPLWQRAHERLRRRLGAAEWEGLMAALVRVTRAARET